MAVPIPTASIRNRIVLGSTCAAAKIVPGMMPVDANIKTMVVGVTSTIGVDGISLEDVNMWLGGPKFGLSIDASALHPHIDKSIKMALDVEPEGLVFQTNAHTTD